MLGNWTIRFSYRMAIISVTNQTFILAKKVCCSLGTTTGNVTGLICIYQRNKNDTQSITLLTFKLAKKPPFGGFCFSLGHQGRPSNGRFHPQVSNSNIIQNLQHLSIFSKILVLLVFLLSSALRQQLESIFANDF